MSVEMQALVRNNFYISTLSESTLLITLHIVFQLLLSLESVRNSFYIICTAYHVSHITRKPVYAIHANNKGADQPAHPHSLISAFIVRCLDSITPLLAIARISRL